MSSVAVENISLRLEDSTNGSPPNHREATDGDVADSGMHGDTASA